MYVGALVYLSNIKVDSGTYVKQPDIKYTPSLIEADEPWPIALEITESAPAPSVLVPPPTIPYLRPIAVVAVNTSPTTNLSTSFAEPPLL